MFAMMSPDFSINLIDVDRHEQLSNHILTVHLSFSFDIISLNIQDL